MKKPQKRVETYAYRKVREKRLRQGRHNQEPCYVCGQKVDYKTRDMSHPTAPTVEHIRSWRDFPDLRLDPGNLAISHRSCNSAKGVKASALPAHGNASRDWSLPQKRKRR